ncbi:MAG: response regulator [Spirochaetales bacterium]|nr:response regulator [Spirochaetales bacterium]
MERNIECDDPCLCGAGFIDPGTGLFERPVFLLELDREFLRSQRSGAPFTVALVDLDGLSGCDSAAGGAGVRESLAEVGRLVHASIRDVDLACRYAPERLALLLLTTSAEVGHVVGDRIRRAVEQRFGGALTVSVGMASFPVDAVDRERLLSRAMEALEHARNEGKTRVYYFTRPALVQEDERARVLVVDDDRRNVRLMSSYLQPENYEVLSAYSGEEALATLGRTEIDLMLLDIMMPGLDGYEVCKRVKSCEATRLVPVILVTALDEEARLRGIESGADHFVTKPANRDELLARVRALVHMRTMNKNLTSIENALYALASAVEAKDNYTLKHTQRVASLAEALGKRLGLSEKEVFALRIGGILHDAGKIGISDEILNKPGKLDEREWEIMRSHPEIGYRICLPLKSTLGRALDVVRHHHEKLDGSSYPDGLVGDQISMAARIMCVADIYDALVSSRPYRDALPKARALEILNEEVRAGKLDSAVVAELADLVG